MYRFLMKIFFAAYRNVITENGQTICLFLDNMYSKAKHVQRVRVLCTRLPGSKLLRRR